MSFMEKRRTSSTTEQSSTNASSHKTGTITELSPVVEQLPFPEYNPLLSGPLQPLSPTLSASLEQSFIEKQSSRTGQLAQETPVPPSQSSPIPQTTLTTQTERITTSLMPLSPILFSNVTRTLPEVTRTLPEVQAGQMDQMGAMLTRSNTTSLRQPLVIRATGKKSKGIRPPQGRRMVVNIAVITLLSFIIVGSLLAVLPADTSAHAGFNPLSPIMKYFSSKTNNTTLLAQQAATATAVTQDGYDPGGEHTYAGVPTAPPTGNGSGSGSSNPVTSGGGPGRFFYGQCTYWANMRYEALTGIYVSWLGNADEWAYGASANGWMVSSYPHVPSIIVLQPGVEGAGPYGHVAIVESINSNGTVYTSILNWAQDGGGFGILSYHNFSYPSYGVSFVWAPGH